MTAEKSKFTDMKYFTAILLSVMFNHLTSAHFTLFAPIKNPIQNLVI